MHLKSRLIIESTIESSSVVPTVAQSSGPPLASALAGLRLSFKLRTFAFGRAERWCIVPPHSLIRLIPHYSAYQLRINIIVTEDRRADET